MKSKILSVVMTCLLSAGVLLVGCGEQAVVKDPAATTKKKAIIFPAKSIKIIVPYAAGGVTDTAARAIAQAASKYLPNKQQLVVDNKPGGGGGIGTNEVVSATPDGYTIGFVGSGVLTNLPHFGNTPYSFTDVTQIMRNSAVPFLFAVKNDAPWKTFDEWQAYVKANSGKFTYATSGAGTLNHILMESLSTAIGTKVKHVPFNGDAPAITALLGGHVQSIVVSATSILTHVREGQVRVLADLSNIKLREFPDVPTLRDKGINIGMDGAFIFVGPRGLPTEIRDIIHDALNKAMEDPEVIETYKKLELTPAYLGPKELEDMVKEDFEKNLEVLKASGLVK